MTQGISCFLAHILTTGTARTMCRINCNVICQRHDFSSQRIIKITGKDIFCEFSLHFLSQVRPTDITNKKGISTEECRFLSIFINQQVAGAFHGMTGRMQNLNLNITQLQQFTIFCTVNFKCRSCIWSIYNFSTGFLSKVYVAGYKISMEMCFQYIFDFCTICFCFADIRFHFTQWVNDGSLTIAFNVICSLSKTSGINLFYFHGFNIWFEIIY